MTDIDVGYLFTQITIDDALNDPDPLDLSAPIPTARITCRVCELKAVVTEEVPITSTGLLCNECRTDLEKTEAHIRSVLATSELSFINAYDRLRADVAHADERTQERYQKVLDALGAAHEGTADPARVRRRYEAARGREDSLGALLREKEVAEEYARLQAWAERAMGEVEAARS